MKIAIKNNQSTSIGIELIKTLENLGGKNINDLSGYSSKGRYYHINEKNIITCNYKNEFQNEENYIFYDCLNDYLKDLCTKITNNLHTKLANRCLFNKILTINYQDI